MTRTVLLGDICIRITDGAHWSPKSTEDGFPMASVKDMEDYSINLKKCRKISKEDYLKLVKDGCRPEENDILIAKDGSFLKHLFVTDGKDDVATLSSIAILKPNLNLVDPKFLVYYIRNQRDNYDLSQYVSGAAIPRIILKSFARMPIKLPELETQKKIANILGSIDEKIELNRKMNETLEQMGQALFHYYFIDNPDAEKWEEGTISDLGEVITGKTPSKARPDYYAHDVMFLKVPDMHGQNIVISTNDHLSIAGANSQNNKYIPKWSTCVSCIATVGVISLAGESIQTNQQINSVIPKNPTCRFYNYFLLREKSNQIKMMASGGTATPNLNKRQFENIKIKLPPEQLLIDFDSTVSNIFEQSEKNQRQVQTLITLRDTLLPRLISGKIRV